MRTAKPYVLIYMEYTLNDGDPEAKAVLTGELTYETIVDEQTAKKRYAMHAKSLNGQIYLVREQPTPAEIDDSPRVVFGAPRKRKASPKVEGEPKRRGGRPPGSRNKPKLVLADAAPANGAA